MEELTCFGPICFGHMDKLNQNVFGFGEFLAGLALMTLAWTNADVLYRFRVKTAPIPLYKITFWSMVGIGLLTLASDLWQAQDWMVPVGPLTPAIWQAILGSFFLFIFLLWTWFAFIWPPVFGNMNSRRFASILYLITVKGSQNELAIIAAELERSIGNIIKFATEQNYSDPDEKRNEPSLIEESADTILLTISDPRFCRAIVHSAPTTAWAIFEEIERSKKYKIQINTFAKNIVLESINFKDSFMYIESSGYHTGIMGYHKPITSTIFGNFRMVENIPFLLSPDGLAMYKWDSEQWDAYCRSALLALQSCIEQKAYYHTSFLFNVKSHLESSIRDLYKLDGLKDNIWDSEPLNKLNVVVRFINDAIKILDKYPLDSEATIRKKNIGENTETVYDLIAEIMLEVVFASSAVTHPQWTCWSIQHNDVWNGLFFPQSSAAREIINFKFRRLVYDEITDLNEFAGFRGASLLAYCLNVMGFEESTINPNIALQRAVLSWTKKNYAQLYKNDPDIAKSCLVEGLVFEEDSFRFVKTGLGRKPHREFFDIEQIPK